MRLSATDADADGLPDDFEQELLQKFSPQFYLSAGDCDGVPAEFQSGVPHPRVIAKNGTIYGQVFPVLLPSKPGAFIEIHYYHLWNRDCGLNGHALDAEHISVLIGADKIETPAASWKDKYWYAAAHEDTVCDASHGTRSSFLRAGQQAPNIWISEGKHASFLNRELCGRGCGSDACRSMRPLIISQIINLGERHAPANGALWIHASGWPLAEKMQTDFSEAVLEKLDAQGTAAAIPINESRPPVQATLHVSGSTAGALTGANEKTNDALSSSVNAVGSLMKKSMNNTGHSVGNAARAVWRAFGGSTNREKK